MRMRALLVVCVLGLAANVQAQQPQLRTRNVILVTLDGLRWQEVFGGVDSLLVHDTLFTPANSGTREEFWAASREERRRKLMPFLWSTMAAHGQLYGDRTAGSLADVTNPYRFSYPGYHELFAGYADPAIRSNSKRLNPNRTIFDFLNEQAGLKGKLAAFASWDVFPFIINTQRSGVVVNAGLDTVPGEVLLNKLLRQLPNPWPGIRHDALTFRYALEHLRKAKPRFLFIGFDETDDFAHEGNFHDHVYAARRTDAMLRELWEWVQATDGYRDATTLIVTTDHGRGHRQQWKDHGGGIEGAQHIWLAVMGPDTRALGVRTPGQIYQNQIAATVAALLGFRYSGDPRIGPPMDKVLP